VSVPRVSRPPAQAQAAERTGVAMAVIMTGVLMTAVDTSMGFMALAAGLSALRARRS
jgi:hypothetical protein